MADGWGGPRRNAGRKPKEITLLRELAKEDMSPHARKALAHIAALLDDPEAPKQLRYAAAVWLCEFEWGKATQTNKNENAGEITVRVLYGEGNNPTSTGAAPVADTGQS